MVRLPAFVRRPRAEKIEIADYDPAWPRRFEEEAARLRASLDGLIGRIEHIGSTAVPGLAAKPIVDLMVEVPDLETVRDIRLGSITGTASKQGNPMTAIYRRSGLTMQSVAANLESVKDLFLSSDIGSLLTEEHGTLAEQVRFEMDQTIRTAEKLQGDPQELVSQPASSEKLDYLRQAIRFAIERLNGEFSAASGLAAGFSFGDGD